MLGLGPLRRSSRQVLQRVTKAVRGAALSTTGDFLCDNLSLFEV